MRLVAVARLRRHSGKYLIALPLFKGYLAQTLQPTPLSLQEPGRPTPKDECSKRWGTAECKGRGGKMGLSYNKTVHEVSELCKQN